MTGRLIDAENVKAEMRCPNCHSKCFGCNVDACCELIDVMPTVEAIPIEWLESHYPPAVNHDSVAYITKATVVEELIREYRSERNEE